VLRGCFCREARERFHPPKNPPTNLNYWTN